MSLAPEWVAGIKWAAIGRYGEQVVVFIVTAVLAHLIAPEAFGIFGMGMLTVGVGMLVADLGTVTVLVQRKGPVETLAPSLFWVNLAMGLALTAASVLVAPAVATFFQEPALIPVVRLLGVGFVIGALGAVPRALLTREMLFNRLAVPQLAGVATGGATGVGMALAGMGVWSLVGQHLVRLAVETGGVMAASRFRPRLKIDLLELRSVVPFSANLSGFNVLAYLTKNVDNLLIGKFLGAQALGYYDIAWRLIQYPVTAITRVVANVLLPTLSKMQEDNARLMQAYVRASTAIALLTFPLLLGMLALAEPFVVIVLGPAWEPAVLLLAILVPVGMAQSIGAATGTIYVAKGRTDVLLRWAVLATVVTVSGISVGLLWGLVGVAVSRLIVNTILTPLNLHIAFRLIGLRLRSLGRALAPVGVAAGIMGLWVGLLHLGWSAWSPAPPWLLLLLGPATGIVIYGAVLLKIRPPILHEILSTLAQADVGWAQRWMDRSTFAPPAIAHAKRGTDSPRNSPPEPGGSSPSADGPSRR